MYHVGMGIEQNQSPCIIDNIDSIYTIIDGKFNLDNKYVIGPINNVTKTIKETINARLAITHHHHHYKNSNPLLVLESKILHLHNYLLNLYHPL